MSFNGFMDFELDHGADDIFSAQNSPYLFPTIPTHPLADLDDCHVPTCPSCRRVMDFRPAAPCIYPPPIPEGFTNSSQLQMSPATHSPSFHQGVPGPDLAFPDTVPRLTQHKNPFPIVYTGSLDQPWFSYTTTIEQPQTQLTEVYCGTLSGENMPQVHGYDATLPGSGISRSGICGSGDKQAGNQVHSAVLAEEIPSFRVTDDMVDRAGAVK